MTDHREARQLDHSARDASSQPRRQVWLLRLAVPLVMLLQSVYAAGWSYLLLSFPADPETAQQHTPAGTALFTLLVTAPAPLLLVSATLLAVTAGRRREGRAVGLAVAVEVLALVSGVVSGGLLLTLGAVGVLVLLAITIVRHPSAAPHRS